MKTGKSKLKLNILTPRGVKFERYADFLTMHAIDGEIGILPGHAPINSVLGDGILKIFNDGSEEKFALFEGIVDVDNDEVNIYTTIAQHPEEIDLERAQREKDESIAALSEDLSNREVQAKLLQIRRALVRIEVAVHSGDTDYFDDHDIEQRDLDDEE